MGLFDTELPIDEALPRLTAALRQNHSAVLVAPPGAGKTTRVPLWLIDTLWAADKKILVLEPRRLAARAVTERLTGCEVERAYVDKSPFRNSSPECSRRAVRRAAREAEPLARRNWPGAIVPAVVRSGSLGSRCDDLLRALMPD